MCVMCIQLVVASQHSQLSWHVSLMIGNVLVHCMAHLLCIVLDACVCVCCIHVMLIEYALQVWCVLWHVVSSIDLWACVHTQKCVWCGCDAQLLHIHNVCLNKSIMHWIIDWTHMSAQHKTRHWYTHNCVCNIKVDIPCSCTWVDNWTWSMYTHCTDKTSS